MTIISYAQNFEDVMLWRAFKNIEKGFYVDIGAAWPETDSVTKLFYDNGWFGINVEPNEIHYNSLKNERERDINLNVAVAEYSGKLDLDVFSDTGLSTADPSISKNHVVNGYGKKSISVDVTTLSDIFNSHLSKGQDIHFLKIDVEGLEGNVIRGNDWLNFRPWIVVVEATLPLTQIESYEEWEPILIQSNYKFVYSDGLNRFYLAKEHEHLQSSFRYPPNFFDDFILAGYHNALCSKEAESLNAKKANQLLSEAKNKAKIAEDRAILAENRVKMAEDRANNYKVIIADLHENVASVQQRYDAILNSNTWKLFGPYRYIRRSTKILLSDSSLSEKKERIKNSLLYRIKKNPKLSNIARRLLIRFPSLKAMFYKTYKVNSEYKASYLTIREERIFKDIKIACSKGDS